MITAYEPRVSLQNISLEDDVDRNRLKVSIYFYVQNVPEPVVVETYLQRLR